MLETLKSLLETRQIKTDAESLASYAKDWTTYYEPKASAVVFPESTADVQKILEFANQQKIAVVPSGGRTGLSGGAVALNGELVLSLERMNKLIEFNEVDKSVEVEAGMITDQVKDFAASKELQFPLSFGATGSSQIGGNLATNAGGSNVLRYGNTRNWVLGVEFVTGSAEVLNLNKGLVKNATGFDLRHLILGSEGSLGVITKAILKLAPKAQDSQSMLLAIKNWEAVTETFAELSSSLSLLAFEVFDHACVQKVETHNLAKLPMNPQELYVIFEFEKFSNQTEEATAERVGGLMDRGLILDAIPSQSPTQSQELWALRENITESISSEKPYKNDISVRPSRIPEFVEAIDSIVKKDYPGFEILWFGHVGDGNLHLNILRPKEMSREEFVQKCRSVDEQLFRCVESFQGSVSAEHGVGLSKKDFLKHSRSDAEIRLMRQIKSVFDPAGILNPGKIFPQP